MTDDFFRARRCKQGRANPQGGEVEEASHARTRQVVPPKRKAPPHLADGDASTHDSDVDSLVVAAIMAKGEQQRLQAKSTKEIAILRARMKGSSPVEAKEAEATLSKNWSQRIEAANLREAQLMAKLHKQCPGGVDLRSRDEPCKSATNAEVPDSNSGDTESPSQ